MFFSSHPQLESILLQANTTVDGGGFGGMQGVLTLAFISIIFIIILTARSQRLANRNKKLLEQKNEEIKKKNQEIANLGKSRSNWFVNVAHELKVPLTLIKGPVEQLRHGQNFDEESQEKLSIASRNIQHLEKLIGEIMDISRLEDGDLSLRRESYDIVKLLTSIYEYFTPLAERKEIDFQIDNQLLRPVHLKIDVDRVKKALDNLVSNAIKFTHEKGKVIIEIEDKGDELIVRIIDDGIGISPNDLTYVFDRYFQANPEANKEGTGVGLSITKEVIELHGGEVQVESEMNVGTTFTVRFPESIRVHGTTLEEVIKEEKPEEDKVKPILKGKTIFIADDNEDMRKYVRGFLSEKFSVHSFRDGKELMDQLEKHPPDLVITDIMMPRMDGHALIQRIKGDPELRKVPVIALTAVTEESEKLEILRLGVDDYLAKPFNSEELLIRIENLILNLGERGGTIEFDDVEEETSYADKLIGILEEEVKANISDANFNVLRLADAGSLSERQLYRYLKQTTGFTPANFIKEIRLQKAFELARRNVYSTTAELSYAVGFQHPSYFSTVFKERFGKKPSDMLKGE